MDLAGYVINAVLVEGRSVTDVCEAHDISRSWLYELIGRYRELGDEGLRRLSKRLGSSPTRVSPPVEEQIVACIRSSPTWASTPGAHTIQRHLLRRRRGRAKSAVPSVATIWRVLSWRMRDTFQPGSQNVQLCGPTRPFPGTGRAAQLGARVTRMETAPIGVWLAGWEMIPGHWMSCADAWRGRGRRRRRDGRTGDVRGRAGRAPRPRRGSGGARAWTLEQHGDVAVLELGDDLAERLRAGRVEHLELGRDAGSRPGRR